MVNSHAVWSLFGTYYLLTINLGIRRAFALRYFFAHMISLKSNQTLYNGNTPQYNEY